MNSKQYAIPVFLTVIFGVLTVCQNRESKSIKPVLVPENAVVPNSKHYRDSISDDPEILKIKAVAKSFHNWYIHVLKSDEQNVSIKILEGENGKCKADTSLYFTELRGIGTISEKFIEKEKLRFKDCIEYIEKIDYSEYSLEPNSFGVACEFLNYMYWLRSQENADGISVESLEKLNEKWYVVLNFYDEENGQIFYWNVHKPFVEIGKVNNSFMITGITWLDD